MNIAYISMIRPLKVYFPRMKEPLVRDVSEWRKRKNLLPFYWKALKIGMRKKSRKPCVLKKRKKPWVLKKKMKPWLLKKRKRFLWIRKRMFGFFTSPSGGKEI